MATLSIEATNAIEEGDNLEFVVSLSEPANDAVSIEYRTLPGTARNSDLYYSTTSRNNGTLTFAPGETSKSIFVETASDGLDERDEHIVLELFDAVGASLANDAPALRATGVILDNDGAGSNLAVFTSDPVLVEGDAGEQAAVFEVRLSRPATSDFTLSYQTVDGSARAGEDYTATSGTLAFAAGQEVASVSVPVLGDTNLEPSEQFSLVVTPPDDVSIGIDGATGVATILDNDTTLAPTLSIASASTEERGVLRFVVSLSEPSVETVSLGYNARLGSAVNADLYWDITSSRNNGTLTFAPGETSKSIFVETASDRLDERDETIFLDLSNISGATFAGGLSSLRAIGVILDMDGVGLNRMLVFSDEIIAELAGGSHVVNVPVMLTRPASQAISYDVTANSVTADVGSDVELVNTTVSFVAGQSVAGVPVRVFGGDGAESDETFILQYTPSAGAAALDTDVAQTVTVRNTESIGPIINEPPLATNDAGATVINTQVVIDVLANDSDADGDPLSLDSLSNPANGTAVINVDGTVTYTPDPDFSGEDGFTYDISDGNGGSDSATVTITVDDDDDDEPEPEPTGNPTAFYTFTNATPSEFFLATGLDAQLLGTTSGKTINIPMGGAARGLDPATTVNLQGASADYNLLRNGTTLEVRNTGDASLIASLSASTSETSSLRFSDGAANLTFEGSNIVIGGAVLSNGEQLAGSALALDGNLTSSGVFTAANTLNGAPEATTFLTLIDTTPETFTLGAGLVVELLGNSAGKAINIPQGAGAKGVDPNTTLYIEGASSAFTFSRNGTTLEVRDDVGNLTASLKGSSTETSTLVFADGFLELAVADSQLTLGGITFTEDLSVPGAVLTVDPSETSEALFGIDLDVLGGTVQNPASVDASDGALTFYDDVVVTSNTQISDFGTDDTLVLQGVSAADIDLSVSDGNTRFEFNDGAGTVSQITLIGVSGDHTSVAEFNDNANLGDVIFA